MARPRFSPLRISGVVCILLAVSAYLPLPMPRAWVAGRLDGLSLDGRPLSCDLGPVRLRWGTGTLVLDSLGIRDRHGFRLSVPRIEVRVGLWPGSEDFLRPRAVHLVRPLVAAEREWLDRLLARSEEVLNLPPMRLSLEDGLFSWEDPEEHVVLSTRLPRLAGTAGGASVVVTGLAEPPWGGATGLSLRTLDGFRTWTLDVASKATPFHLKTGALLPWGETRARSFNLKTRLVSSEGSVEAARLDLSLEGWSGSLPGSPLEWEDLDLLARGDLAGGVRLETSARVQGRRVEAAGWLRRLTGEGLGLDVQGSTEAFRFDEPTLAELREIEPDAAMAAEAFGPEGDTPVHFCFEWREGGGLLWLARLPLDGLGLQYRGFPEEDGQRPSFPYPIQEVTGEVIGTGDLLLTSMAGRVGAGTVESRGFLRLGDGRARIAVDTRIRGLGLDPEVGSALQGAPDLASIWRDMGGIQDGSADLDLVLRRPAGRERVDLAIHAVFTAMGVRPIFLPVPAILDRMSVDWRPGRATLVGSARALGGSADFIGVVEGAVGEERPSVQFQVRGSGLFPVEEERAALERTLDLPPLFGDFAVSGPTSLRLRFRRPAGEADAAILAEWSARDALLEWLPTRFECRLEQADLCVFRSGEETLVSLPRGAVHVEGDTILVSFESALPAGSGDRALLASDDLGLGAGILEAVDALLEVEEGVRPEVGGRIAGLVELEPDSGRAKGSVELRGIRIREPGMLEGVDEASVRGRVFFDGDRFRSPELALVTRHGQVFARELEVAPGPGEWRAACRLDSPAGIEIGTGLAELAAPGFWAALDRLGLTGRVGAEALRLDLHVPLEGQSTFSATGRLLLREMAVTVPPGLSRGSGDFQIQEFSWKGPEDFRVQMRLERGGFIIGGLRASNAHGDVELDPRAITFRRFSTEVLGGRVFTQLPDQDPAEAGLIQVRFTPEAPLRAKLHLRDLEMSKMRDELGLGGSLAGKVSGMIDVTSTTPSPLDYSGQGELEIREGILGTVPVLADIWKVAEVNPPQFNRGSVRWRANSVTNRGRIRIDRFELEHALLNVEGEGWAGLDGYLQMKATVRTLGPLTRIPPISWLIDFIAEQNIRGPVDRPVVTARISEGSQEEEPRPRFPLWVPEIPAPNWRRSPALPPGGRPGNGSVDPGASPGG